MPTTNPVPSTDPTDLLFNAGKLDEVVNSTANSFTDRRGIARRTVAGMNADFDAQLADAESDLNVYRADAAASAAEALGYLQTIRATSYGAYASDPATDPLGNPPTVGDEYFNTTSNLLKRWNGTTWQASDINTANLAASSGSSMVGYDAGTVQDVLDGAKSLQDYAALRAYNGRAKRIYITGLLVTAKPAGIAGVFQYDPTDTTSIDDAATVIVGTDGRRWKRDYDGNVNVKWFGANGDGIDDTAAILAAAASGKPIYFPKPSVSYIANSNVTFTAEIDAGVYNVFGGTGTIVLANAVTQFARPEWFGGSINKAYAACKRILLLNKIYTMTQGLTIDARESQIIGCGYGSVVVFDAPAETTAITIANNFVKLDNFRLYGIDGRPAQIGVKMNAVIMCDVKIWIQYFSDRAIVAGIDANNAANLNNLNSYISYCGNGIDIVSGTKNNIIGGAVELVPGIGIKIAAGTSNTIGDTYFEANGTHISLLGAAWGHTIIRGNYLRRWSVAGIKLNQFSSGAVIESNSFSTDMGSPSNAIVDDGAINTTFGYGNMYETVPLARGTHVSLQSANSVATLGVWKDNNTLLFTGGPVATSGATETDLASATIPGKALGKRSVVRLESNGDMIGSTGAHTIKVYFGATVITALTTTPAVNWSVDVDVIANNSYTSQEIVVKVVSGSSSSVLRTTAAVDTSAAATFKITGQAITGESVTLRHAKVWYDERI